MHVVLVIPRFYPFWGGTEIRIKRVAETLIPRGFRFTVLTRRLSWAHAGRETVDGIDVVRLPANRTLFGFCVRRWLARHHDEIELVHSFRLDKCAAPAAWAAQRYGLAHIAEIITNEATKMLASSAGRRRVARLAAGTTVFHCLTDDVADKLADAGIPAGNLWRRGNAVDTETFHPAAAPVATLQVLCSGRIERQKGTDVLIAAWRQLPADLHRTAKLLLAGSGKWEKRLRAETDDLDSVAFLGAVSRAAMPEIYRQASIYVQPSRFEGMSNAILEAMASGLPIVSTAIDANRALIADGVNGLTVASEDAWALARALEWLLRDAALRIKMGEASRARAEERFALPALFDDYETVYRRLAPRERKEKPT